MNLTTRRHEPKHNYQGADCRDVEVRIRLNDKELDALDRICAGTNERRSTAIRKMILAEAGRHGS